MFWTTTHSTGMEGEFLTTKGTILANNFLNAPQATEPREEGLRDSGNKKVEYFVCTKFVRRRL